MKAILALFLILATVSAAEKYKEVNGITVSYDSKTLFNALAKFLTSNTTVQEVLKTYNTTSPIKPLSEYRDKTYKQISRILHKIEISNSSIAKYELWVEFNTTDTKITVLEVQEIIYNLQTKKPIGIISDYFSVIDFEIWPNVTVWRSSVDHANHSDSIGNNTLSNDIFARIRDAISIELLSQANEDPDLFPEITSQVTQKDIVVQNFKLFHLDATNSQFLEYNYKVSIKALTNVTRYYVNVGYNLATHGVNITAISRRDPHITH